MSESTEGRDELDDLLGTLRDASLSDEQAARLDQLLASDPDARSRYLETILLYAALRPAGGLGRRGHLVAVDGATPDPVRRRGRVTRRLGWAAAAILAGVVALWGRAGGDRPSGPNRPGIALVVGAAGVEPAAGSTARPPAVGDVVAAGNLRFGRGRVAIAFFTGVTLQVEGPADLDLLSEARVACRSGKLRARVPRGAEGFVVESPGSAVVDLGTDFALNVGPDGKSQVMVFEGQAEAVVLDESGTARRTRHLTQDRAVEIDPRSDRFVQVEARPEGFLRPAELAIPPLTLHPGYPSAVVGLGPRGYWRFESMDGGVVPNEVAGGPPLRATGPVRLVGDGNRRAEFATAAADQYLVMDGTWAPPRDLGYAVELWFCAERIASAALAGLIVPGDPTVYNHLFYLELTAQDRHSILFRPASVRSLHRWPPRIAGGDNLYSDHYVPYRWHHIVAQVRDDHMELYLDGSPSPRLSIGPERATEACRLILGQLKPNPRPPDPWQNRPFRGQLDELALYDRPLAAEEIRRHHALGTAPGRSPRP